MIQLNSKLFLGAALSIFSAQLLAVEDGSCDNPFTYRTVPSELALYRSGVVVINGGVKYECISDASCQSTQYEPGHSNNNWTLTGAWDDQVCSVSSSSSSSSSSSGAGASSSSGGISTGLDLSNTPLMQTSSGDPNILLILDNSASMMNTPAETPYNFPADLGGDGSDSNSFRCGTGTGAEGSSAILPADGYVYEFESSAGIGYQDAYIIQKAVDGSTATPMLWSKTNCFAHATQYNALLVAFGGTVAEPKWAYQGSNDNGQFSNRRHDESLGGFAGHPKYFGHYLNWYYGNNVNPHSSHDNQIQGFDPLVGSAAINDYGTEKTAANSRMVIMVHFLIDDVGLMADGGALTDAAQVAVATFDPDVDPYIDENNPGSKDYTSLDYRIATDKTPSNLRILDGFAEIEAHNFTPELTKMRDVYTPGGYNYLGTKVDADDQSLRSNTSLARGLKQAARYFLEDGTATGETLKLTTDTAIAANGGETINAFDLFDEEPVYTTKGPKPAQNNRVQSCLKNHIIALTDGLSRTTSDGIAADGFSPDYTGDILSVYHDSTPALPVNDKLVAADAAVAVAAAKVQYDAAVAAAAADPTNTALEARVERAAAAVVDAQQKELTDLIDVAEALYSLDLRPDIPEFTNNISTYIFSLQPSSEDSEYLEKAAIAGGGLFFGVDRAFYPFRSVMEEQLAEIIADIRAQGTAITGTAAKPVFSTDKLKDDTTMYQSRFSTVGWYGTLKGYDLDSTTGAVQYPENWEASDVLPSHSQRNIFTKGSSDAVAFTTSNLDELTDTQRADLAEVPSGSSLTSAEMIEYLRGNQSYEGVLDSNFRLRPRSLLGDMVNSAPVYVGAPDMYYSESNHSGYLEYKAAKQSRAPMVYVGANDGMLHAFNAETGVEEWAYIPQAMFKVGADEGMSALAHKGFNDDHRYYVDGTPVVVDVYIDHDGTITAEDDSEGKQWRTVLIGTMRAGARGIFALDVTDPVPAGGVDYNDLLLWEISGNDLVGDFADVGHIYGDPSVVKLDDNRWGVVFGNGYSSSANKAALYVLDVLDGSLISKVTVEENNVATNGMAQPKLLDLDGNGTADRIYAGDLLGNMWAFETYLSGTDSQWRSDYISGSGPVPLFNGQDPITSAPVLMHHPEDLAEPNVVVLFGTGKLLEITDLNTLVDSRVYGVFDRGIGGLSRTNLVERELTTSASSRKFDASSTVDDAAAESGWYFDLEAGERAVTNPRLYRGVLFLSTLTPSDAACDLGGNSWLLTVNPVTGATPDFAILDTNNDNDFNADDIGEIGVNLRGVTTTPAILSDRMYIPGTAQGGDAIELKLGPPTSNDTNMLTWEEIFRHW